MKRREILSQWAVLVMIAGLTLGDFVVKLLFPDNLPAWVQVCWLLLVLGAGAVSFRKKPAGMTEWLITGYFLWTVVTRLVLGDLGYKAEIELLRSASIMLVFLLVRRMPEEQSRRVWQILGGLLCAYLTVWAVQGLRVAATGGEPFGFWRQVLTIQEEEAVRFVQVGDLHRNATAAWFMVGLWLLCIQWSLCKKKIWRVPIALDAVLMYCMVAMQRCRSICVAIGAGFGLLAAMGVWKLAGNRKRPIQIILALLTAMACTVTVYKSFTWTNDGIVKISEPIRARLEEERFWELASQEYIPEGYVPSWEMTEAAAPETTPEAAPSETVPAETQAEEPQGLLPGEQVTDNRSFFRDLLTLTMRIEVWQAELHVVSCNPMFLLFGQKRSEIVNNLAIYSGMVRVSHTHNGYMQILALYGLPGLVLFGLFSLLLVKKMVLLFFSDAPVSRKLFLIPVAALFLYSVMEPLFCSSCMPSVCFALFAAGLDRARN